MTAGAARRCEAAALAAVAAPPPADHAQLVAECEALAKAAVQTNFGWGWAAADAKPAAGRRGPVAIDLRTTARVGLALHLAGRRTGQPRFTAAAFQAARAVAAVQANTGQVPATGVIRANAGGKDQPAPVPAREPTCAGLALMLVVIRDAAETGTAADRIEPLKRAAAKAAHWLTTQQTRSGGWPVLFTPPAPKGGNRSRAAAPVRMIRLDEPGFRDATVALWLAARVLEDAKLANRAEAAIEELAVLRIDDDKSPGRGLWSSAYSLNEAPLAGGEDYGLPYEVSLAASRNAMQALLAAALLSEGAPNADAGAGGDAPTAAPLMRDALAAIERLPQRDGQWERRYDIHPRKGAPAQVLAADDAPESELFRPETGAAGGDGQAESPAVDVHELVEALRRVEAFGAAAYRDRLAAQVPVEHRLAMTVCGMGDDLLTAETPHPKTPQAGAATGAGRLSMLLRRALFQGAPAPEGK